MRKILRKYFISFSNLSTEIDTGGFILGLLFIPIIPFALILFVAILPFKYIAKLLNKYL